MKQVENTSETILSETFSAHRRQYKYFYNVSTIIISILMLGSSIGLGFCIYHMVISMPKPPASYKIGIDLLSGIALTLVILLWTCLRARRSALHDLKMISNNKTKPLIWRLDGDQWIK
jgi:hypothetical protein